MKLETEVEQDVTTVITRIGDFRADSKVKWVDMCDSYNPLNGGKMREYRVRFVYDSQFNIILLVLLPPQNK